MIQLLIQLDEKGTLSLAGSVLDDPLVCYGLLELAKDAVRAKSAGNQPLIEVPPPGLFGPKKH